MSLGPYHFVPTVSPAAVIAEVACDSVIPTTLGTATWPPQEPDEAVILTPEPGEASVPAGGFWLITCFAGTVLLHC